MKLGKKQELFARQVPRLIDKAHELGFEVRLGDTFRDPRTHGEYGVKKGYGHYRSCHKLKTAIDLLLFKKGKYLTKTKDYEKLGFWWERQHIDNRWGGRFNDGNHFSMTHWGSM